MQNLKKQGWDKLSEDEIRFEVTELLQFLDRHGTSTYDPNDAVGSPLYLWALSGRRPDKLLARVILGRIGRASPLRLRKLLGVRPSETAGGLAFLGRAYLDCYSVFGDSLYVDRSRELLERLSRTGCEKWGGKGWGFPFGWHSFCLVPAGTPIGHTTMSVGNAFYQYYQVTAETWALREASQCCEFFLEGLNRADRPTGSIALSYTPLDRSQVINTNADIAALLYKVGKEVHDSAYSNFAFRILRFVLETQNRDGSWCYNAPDFFGGPSKIDNYHTGMVLSSITAFLEDPELPRDIVATCRSALATGTEYFLENLFTESGLPKYTNESLYPINIYGFAQSMATLLCLEKCNIFEEKLKLRITTMLGALLWQSLRTMRSSQGGFVTARLQDGRVHDLRSLRWANAFMLSCLALLLKRQGRED